VSEGGAFLKEKAIKGGDYVK